MSKVETLLKSTLSSDKVSQKNNEIPEMSRNLLSFLISSKTTKEKEYAHPLWYELLMVGCESDEMVCELVDGLRVQECRSNDIRNK